MLNQSFLYGYYQMLSLRFSLYVSLLLNLVLDKIGCWVCECWWRSDLFCSLEWFCIEGFALFFFFLGWDFGTIFPSSFSILILFGLLWLLEIMYLWEKNSKLYLLFLMTPRLLQSFDWLLKFLDNYGIKDAFSYCGHASSLWFLSFSKLSLFFLLAAHFWIFAI